MGGRGCRNPFAHSGDSWLDSSDYVSNDVSIMPRNWSTAADGKSVYEDILALNGGLEYPNIQFPLNYFLSGLVGSADIVINMLKLRKQKMNDKFKHALINCNAAQYGKGGYDAAFILSNLKELNDVYNLKSNTLEESQGDQYANKIGRYLGTKYPAEDCETLISPYIQK